MCFVVASCLSPCYILQLIWEFPKMRGPNVDPKEQGSCYEDPYPKDPQSTPTAICETQVTGLLQGLLKRGTPVLETPSSHPCFARIPSIGVAETSQVAGGHAQNQGWKPRIWRYRHHLRALQATTINLILKRSRMPNLLYHTQTEVSETQGPLI